MEDVLAHNQNNPRQLFSSCENTSSSKQQQNLNVLCLLFAVAYSISVTARTQVQLFGWLQMLQTMHKRARQHLEEVLEALTRARALLPMRHIHAEPLQNLDTGTLCWHYGHRCLAHELSILCSSTLLYAKASYILYRLCNYTVNWKMNIEYMYIYIHIYYIILHIIRI